MTSRRATTRRVFAAPAFAGLLVAVVAACTSPPAPAPVPAPVPASVSASAPAAATAAAPANVATASSARDAARKPGAGLGTGPGRPAGASSDRPALFSGLTAPGNATPKPRTPVDGPKREGTVIRGPVNVYTFSPKEDFVPADPALTSVAQVLADMGPDAVEWYQHVQTLSNPWFEGRAPGSDGIERAAQYCAFWMQKAGLEPAFAEGSQANPADPWRQPFDLPGRERRVTGASLRVGELELSVKPMRNSGDGVVEKPIAFVGYGIESGKDGYSSFAEGERLDGRIALVFRGEPLDENGKSRWGGEKFTSASSLAGKLAAIASRGADGILVCDPPGYAGKKTDLSGLSAESLGGAVPIPCFVVATDVAETLARASDPEGRDLAALRRLADEATKDAPFRAVSGRGDVVARLEASVDSGRMVTHNVGGILRGRGRLADEWIVVGAHYDHVGFGAYGADPANRGKLHPGADDNASGTSGMLVLARRLAENYRTASGEADLRSVLFLAFSAEEMGLNGSRAYVKSPSIPADKVDVMLNMDMIGRLRNGEIVVGGVESAKGFSAALEPMFRESGLKVFADPSGRSPSDHASFFGVGIPVLFFFSGVHDSYHKPGDRGYSVDPRGVEPVLDLVERIATWRASAPDRLEFQNGAPPPRPVVVDAAPGGQDRGYAPVRLGIQPGMSEEGESGIVVEGVSPGTSAADAGIRPGDVLLSWNGDPLGVVTDMMAKLRASKPGDVAKIRILRGNEEIVLDVELKASTAPRRPSNE